MTPTHEPSRAYHLRGCQQPACADAHRRLEHHTHR